MKDYLRVLLLIGFSWSIVLITSCQPEELIEEELINTDEEPEPIGPTRLVCIVNAGSYQGNNSSLSVLDISTNQMTNNVYYAANQHFLGGGAGSMVDKAGLGYIPVYGSDKIEIIDLSTFTSVGTISVDDVGGMIAMLNNGTALVSRSSYPDYSPNVLQIDLQTNSVVEEFNVGTKYVFSMFELNEHLFFGGFGMPSTQYYGAGLWKVDASSYEMLDSVDIEEWPVDIDVDANGMLWVLSNGGANVTGLFKVNPETMERIYKGAPGHPEALTLANTFVMVDNRQSLLVCARKIYKMGINDALLPNTPFIDGDYGLIDADPENGLIYATEAWQSDTTPGRVFRFLPDGTPLDTFIVGIRPGGFCFVN